MGKWEKLKKNPTLFFQDMVDKRLQRPYFNKSQKYLQTINNFNRFTPYTHILHSGENSTGLSHLDMWIPFFEASKVSYFILVRDIDLFTLLESKYPSIPIIYAKTKKEVDLYIKRLCCVKACFYPSNTGNNLHLLHYNDIKHIFIGHGDSDKTASAHKYFRVYDENWVAGDAHIDRFHNAGFNFVGLKSVKVGRPSLQPLLKNSQVDSKERFNGKLHLLYLSTWEGVYEEQNYTSVYIIEEIFSNILMHFDSVSVKLHPWIGKRNSVLSKTSSKLSNLFQKKKISYTIASKEVPVSDLVAKANIFICDISAIITDVLSADAPIFVYIPEGKDIKLSKSKMSYEDYTYIFSTTEELLTKMSQVLGGDDYLKQNRKKAMEYILGKEETLQDMFIQKLRSL